MTAYLAHYLVMVGIYSILALSLNLLVGYVGIFSLAHAAIYGVGAYASALVALHLGLGFWGGLVVAAVAGACAAAMDEAGTRRYSAPWIGSTSSSGPRWR